MFSNPMHDISESLSTLKIMVSRLSSMLNGTSCMNTDPLFGIEQPEYQLWFVSCGLASVLSTSTNITQNEKVESIGMARTILDEMDDKDSGLHSSDGETHGIV